MESKNATLIDSGVDWLTVTSSDRKRGLSLARAAVNLMKIEGQHGNERKPWSAYGYDGWRQGGVRTGERVDGLVVQLSSGCAREYWKRFYSLSDNCSRIDLQLTVRTEESTAHTIARHHKEAKRFLSKRKNSPALSLFSCSDGSSTLYLGKRSSDLYGRIYDKGVESGDQYYSGATRYEVEYKGDHARAIATGLSRAEDQKAFTFAHVSAFFAKRGAVLRFCNDARKGVMGSGNESLALCPPLLSRSRSDSSKRLTWLRHAVRPSIQTLVRGGRGNDVLTALGVCIDSNGSLVVPLWDQSNQSQKG